MTIQKKSLISTLNTTKKAIVASTPVTPVASTSEGRASARRTNARPSARRTNARPSARRTNARPSARAAD